EIIERRPFGGLGVRRTAQHTACRAAQKIDQDVVVLDAAVGIVPKPIQHVDHRADVHVEACFLANLACDCRLERLPELDGSSRQAGASFSSQVWKSWMRPSSQSFTNTPEVMCIAETRTVPSFTPLLLTTSAISSVMRTNS